MNNLTPMKTCPGVQCNLNWMPGYNTGTGSMRIDFHVDARGPFEEL